MTITEAPTERAATIGALPDVINAIVDTPSGLALHEVPMSASPLTFWNSIHAAQGGSQ